MPDVLEFKDGTGAWHLLTHPDNMPYGAGTEGRFMPPFVVMEDVVPFEAGARLRGVRTDIREVTVPILLVEADEVALRTKIRQLASFMNPHLGEGILRSSSADGVQRDLRCIYKESWEGKEGPGNMSCVYYQSAVTFHAFDPYWYDTQPTVLPFGSGVGGQNFLGNPFLPIKLNPSQIFGDATVVNNGDIPAWPVWTVTGPGSDLILANTTTGESFEVDVTLTSGQKLVIDTRPGFKTVKKDGVSVYSSLTPESVLWQLPLGTSEIDVSLTSSTSASKVELSFYQGWNSA